MTTVYDPTRGALTLTLLACAPNVVSLVRTKQRDGYSALQLSYPVSLKKQGKKEFRVSEAITAEAGTETTVENFAVGDEVRIVGTTKGKGFQGVVKRHGFHGSDQTHGHKHDHRAPGSIGSSFPEHVVKGKRMGGRMGGEKSTKKSYVEYVDSKKNVIGIRGAIPGSIGSTVSLQGIE